MILKLTTHLYWGQKCKKCFALPAFIALIFTALIFSSCNNLFEEPVNQNNTESPAEAATEAEKKYISISGSMIIDGALPAEYAQLCQPCHAELASASPYETPKQVRGDSDTSRTAFPTIPASGITYVIKAINTTNSNDYYSGTPSFDYSSYTVGIPASETAKTYKIHISVILSGFESEYVLLSGESSEFTISSTTPVVTNLDINLTANGSDGRGIINLSIDVSGSGINSAVATYKSGNVTTTMNATKSGDILTFKDGVHTDDELEDGLSTGSWAITFNFYTTTDRTGEIVYSFTETVNIFDNLTTNTWVQNGNEPWFVTTTDAGGNKSTTCRITAAMVEGYALKDIYVDSTRTTTNPSASTYTTQSGTFINPVTSFAAALAMLHDAGKDYTIYIMGEINGTCTIPDTLKKTGSGGSYTYARSLTLRGYTGLSEGVPQDSINGGYTENDNGHTLEILTEVPVIIKNLKITGGYSASDVTGGGGIFSTGDLTLDSGALVTGNYSKSCGGGVYNDGGILRIKSDAVISDNHEVAAVNNCGGGGVFNNNGTLIMSGGTIKANTAAHDGGGIYNTITNGDNLCVAYIYGDAVIGGDAAEDGNKALGTNSDGGGIYNKGGLIYFGCAGYLATGNQMEDVTYYDPDPAKIIPWTGKLSHNTTGGWGGGIINYPGTLAPNTYGHKVTGIIHVQSGKISSNSAKMGGGIAHHNGTLFYIHGGTIGGDSASEGNSATNKGGGIYTMGKFFLKGGTVSYNTADLGGGVCGDNGLLMYGGTIKNNTATTHGGGVFVDYRSLQIRGSAYIPAGSDGKNDVYLNKRDTEADPAVVYLHDPVTPPAECTDGIVALITPNEYIDNKEIITIASSETATTTIENEYKKFLITPQVSGSVTTCWGINKSNGTLKHLIGKKNRPDAKYDIVFNDGSATAYSSGLSLSDDDKAAAIAVIYYIGTDCSNDGTTVRKLGVGLKQSSSKLKFISGPLENQYISPIRCWIPDDHRTPTQGWQINPGEDVNGSDNLEQIKQYMLSQGMEDNTNDSSKYPLFYFAKNYASQTGSNVSGTDYTEGWYIPSSYELAHIFWEPYGNTCTLFRVNQALNKCGGTQLRASESDPNNEFLYGSSSRNDTSFHPAIKIGNFEYNYIEAWDAESCYAIAIHEF